MNRIAYTEIKTTEEAYKAISEVDCIVRESIDALDLGKVRPSASGLVRDASGLVRDASGLLRDASGLVRDASGLVRDDGTVENYKELCEQVRALSWGISTFSRYVRRVVDLGATEEASGLVRDASGLVRDASGLVRDASGLVRDASGLVRDASGLVR
jgi:hypothetical protein